MFYPQNIYWPTSFENKGSLAQKILHILCINVCRILLALPLRIYLDLMRLINDHSRYCWIYAIGSTTDVFSTLWMEKRMIEKLHGWKLKVLYSDALDEYVFTKMEAYNTRRGIEQQLRVPGNPRQNGIVEKLNRTLLDLVRSRPYHKKRSTNVWLRRWILLFTFEFGHD